MQVLRSVASLRPQFAFVRTVTKSVPIILMEDVWNLGKKGEIVTVRPGYMRNCLYPGKKAIYDIPMNRQKLGIDASVQPHHPVKGEPTAEEMERRRPKGYKITLDSFERDDDAGNISDMKDFNMEIVNNRLSITRITTEEKSELKKLKRSGKLRIRNHGDSVEVKE